MTAAKITFQQGEFPSVKESKSSRRKTSADIIRYTKNLKLPPVGRSNTFVTARKHEGQDFWVLSDVGRRIFSYNIENTGLYSKNHPDLEALKAHYPDVRLPSVATSVRFQVWNVLAAHRDFGFTRQDLEAFNRAWCADEANGLILSKDIIQAARHVEQDGLARVKDLKVGNETVYLLHEELQYWELLRQDENDYDDDAFTASYDRQTASAKSRASAKMSDYDISHTRPGGKTVMAQHKSENRSDRDKYFYDIDAKRIMIAPSYLPQKILRHYSPLEIIDVITETIVKGCAEGILSSDDIGQLIEKLQDVQELAKESENLNS
jgi:hypothetical protein